MQRAAKIEVAAKMFQRGRPLDEIVEDTGLSSEADVELAKRPKKMKGRNMVLTGIFSAYVVSKFYVLLQFPCDDIVVDQQSCACPPCQRNS